MVLAANVGSGFSSSVQADKQRAEQLLLEAIERDPNRSMAHAAMGLLRTQQDRQAEAEIEYQTAVALDPNNAWAVRRLGQTFMLTGQPEACIPYAEKAIKLNPRETVAYVHLGKCHLLAGHNVDEALAFFRKGQAANPGIWWIHLKLAGALGLKGEIEEARAEAAEMVKLKPDMNSVARVRGYVWYRNPQFQVLHDRTIIQGLRNAGFPEELAVQQ